MAIDGKRLGAEAAELRERRSLAVTALDDPDVALVAAAPFPRRSGRFRQANEFFYLTGLEVPGAYVLIDGQGSTTVYLPHRDAQRERTDGPALWAEDVDVVREISGADAVKPLEAMPAELARRLFRGPMVVHTPFAPSEGERESRDGLLGGTAARLADPLRAHPPAGGSLQAALAEHFPLAECRDLTPVLDEMRLIKSPSELTLMREAGRLTGIAVMEAMRSTEPGIHEYELSAVAEFAFLQGGAAGGSYEAIVATGTNAWHGHYVDKTSVLRAGELVLMDYAPDFNYYTSDIGRMWPVSGRWEDWQLELYGFILRYHTALLARIRPGVTAADVLDAAADEMRDVVEQTAWSAPEFEAAARAALVFRGHLSHPVGMSVHDVGVYRHRPFEAGLVFTVDPMLWVPERSLYIRCEDTVVVVPGGIENLTGAVPLEPPAIEATIAEQGLLQYWRDR